MLMRTLLSLITKYAVILIINYLFGKTWFYLKSIILPVDSIDDINFWHNLPDYSSYAVKIIVAILLLIDVKKFRLNIYLIPLIGLFYPLLGICSFLIILIYSRIKVEHKLPV
jgi:hypothetical protein